MLPLLQKLKKLEKSAFSKLQQMPQAVPSENNVETTVTPVAPALSEDDLRKSIASKLQGYRPLDKEANFTGPKYMG